MEDQEKSYEVNDKRRINADESAKVEETTEDTSTQQDQGPESGMPMPEIDVYMILGFTINSLAEKAWETMGLRLAPGAKELKKDLVQAKIAVDTIAFLVDKLSSQMSEDEKKSMKAAVSDLQINYVRQSS